MKRKALHNLKILAMSIILLFPAMLIAGEYTIKKGDTLWDISEERLGNPFLWPDLWKANPYIKNPHLIYPGNKLSLPDTVTKQEKEEIKESIKGLSIEKKRIIPVVRAMPDKIPIQKKRYLVSREIFLQSGYISSDINTIGKITGSHQGRVITGRGDYIYIQTDKPVALTTKLYVIKKPEKLFHPKTEEFLGYLIKIKGLLEVIGEDNGYVKASVLESYEEIMKNDLLTIFYPVELPIEPDIERMPDINGTVIKVLPDIIYLDKGMSDGIKIGDNFKIVSEEKPHIQVGQVVVINASDKSSVALIKGIKQEIKQGDLFRN